MIYFEKTQKLCASFLKASKKRLLSISKFHTPYFVFKFCAMAQDNDNNAPPATSSDSMSSGKDKCGSKGSSRLVLGGAIDKGKGVPKIEEKEEEGCRSKGKIMTAPVVASRRDGRSGGRRGDRELHIITERERRRRMSEMFTKLHGLLPTLPDKVMRLADIPS